MLVSVVSVHTELLTPALWFVHVSLLAVCSVHTSTVDDCSAHEADVACWPSHSNRPAIAALLDAVSAAVPFITSTLEIVKFDVALRAVLAGCCNVCAALMALLAVRLAATALVSAAADKVEPVDASDAAAWAVRLAETESAPLAASVAAPTCTPSVMREADASVTRLAPLSVIRKPSAISQPLSPPDVRHKHP